MSTYDPDGKLYRACLNLRKAQNDMKSLSNGHPMELTKDQVVGNYLDAEFSWRDALLGAELHREPETFKPILVTNINT